MPIEDDSTLTLTQTGQEAFYWIITSVWTIVPEIEFIQHLVIMIIGMTNFLGLPLINTLPTDTMPIVIHFGITSTILGSVAGITVACQLPSLLQAIILK